MNVETALLELYLHENTGIEYAGDPEDGKFKLQITNRKVYRKWLADMKRKNKFWVKSWYPESVKKLNKEK